MVDHKGASNTKRLPGTQQWIGIISGGVGMHIENKKHWLEELVAHDSKPKELQQGTFYSGANRMAVEEDSSTISGVLNEIDTESSGQEMLVHNWNVSHHVWTRWAVWFSETCILLRVNQSKGKVVLTILNQRNSHRHCPSMAGNRWSNCNNREFSHDGSTVVVVDDVVRWWRTWARSPKRWSPLARGRSTCRTITVIWSSPIFSTTEIDAQGGRLVWHSHAPHFPWVLITRSRRCPVGSKHVSRIVPNMCKSSLGLARKNQRAITIQRSKIVELPHSLFLWMLS